MVSGEDSDSSGCSLQNINISSLSSANEITEDLTTAESNEISSSDESVELAGLIDLGIGVAGKKEIVKPRPYQLEMLEQSLSKNIIVAQDTGSGKTHIAVLRILHELERMPSHQIIWFLAPTVSLCAQQFDYLLSQITSVPMKYLSGADGVDRWTEQNQWNSVLHGCKVVVSTYQILLDALTHAFVRMDSLALIVFDEAHNCVGKQAGAKMMKNHYHPRKKEGKHVPHILGLTASPLMRSDPASLEFIEATLDAICRTPTRHRSELRLQVKLPVFSQVYFEGVSTDLLLSGYTRSIKSLGKVYRSLDIQEDPYIIALKGEESDRSRRTLEKLLINHKTWSNEQIKAFYNTSLRMCSELGAWAADHYIAEVVANSTKFVGDDDDDDEFSGLWNAAQTEKQYLANALSKVIITRTESNSPSVMLVSDKVNQLIQTLASQSQDFRGIIFVQERATAEILARLLRIHTQTRDLFNVGTMVGNSTSGHRARNVADVVNMKAQKHVLSRFRTGEINLVVATSVLEEGIDVPACNVVLCFQKPANLKSFVQRRGRARQKESKLILFLELGKDDKQLGEFQKLEEIMKKIYEDDMRELAELVLTEDDEENGDRTFRVTSTGALLELDNAVAHLHHFCATLPAREYVDLRPEFICSEEDKRVRATVLLPLLVDESVRTASSLTTWKSEKNAIKDAAFEAYVALYKAGLINDNLLPLMRHDAEAGDLMSSTTDKRASVVEASEQMDPWITVAQAWMNEAQIRQTSIKIDDLEMDIFLPVDLPPVPSFSLYWDSQTELTITTRTKTTFSKEWISRKALLDTYTISNAAYSKRFTVLPKQQVMSFSPKGNVMLQKMIGQRQLTREDLGSLDSMSAGLIQDKQDANITYIYKGYSPGKPLIKTIQAPFAGYESAPQDEPYLSIKRLPRRNDFLNKVFTGHEVASTKDHSNVLPLSRAVMDKMPFQHTRFALLLPSILHHYGIYLLAHQLSSTILKVVQISDIGLVVTAICASSAQEPTNYQRVEFLGDSILKLCTSIQLMAEYPVWHEGLLSFKKDRLVSNSRLAKASVEAGIDKFIVTKQFTANKWRPLYAEDLVKSTTRPQRKISSKTLADVVEALIGAATLDGGIPKALTCLSIFLPELNWKPLKARQSFFYQRAPDLPLPPILAPLEDLLGYKFTKPSLLIEALTHASYISNTANCSLERLEHLGDAILDNVIVFEMYPHNLHHMQMHLTRTAMVNADFLAWMCLEWSIEIENTSISPTTLETISKGEAWSVWRFLRHSSPSLSKSQQTASKRHASLRDEINLALESGSNYPWALLSKLDAPKFFSDMIESLIGAIWIDSYSHIPLQALNSDIDTDSYSFDIVKEVLEKMGMIKYMRRILKEKVHILHPKEELGILADSETVKYVMENRKGGQGEMEFLCTVWVGEERIVGVEGGVSKLEAKTKAAERAVRILKERKQMGEEGGGELMDDVQMESADEEDGGVMIFDGR